MSIILKPHRNLFQELIINLTFTGMNGINVSAVSTIKLKLKIESSERSDTEWCQCYYLMCVLCFSNLTCLCEYGDWNWMSYTCSLFGQHGIGSYLRCVSLLMDAYVPCYSLQVCAMYLKVICCGCVISLVLCTRSRWWCLGTRKLSTTKPSHLLTAGITDY